MMDKEILKIIQDIRSNKENLNRCFECSMLFPNFISKNNGIFLCFVCAEFHSKSLCRDYSDLIEITPECLSDFSIQESINYLFCGGNKRFSDFLEGFDLKQTAGEELFHDEMFIKKYKTKAAKFYRKVLDCEVKGVVDYENQKVPSFEEGREIENDGDDRDDRDERNEGKKKNLRQNTETETNNKDRI
jgi:hypothetical protein